MRKLIEQLFIDPPKLTLIPVYYKDILEERKARVRRVMWNAAKDDNLQVVIRSKIISEQIDRRIIQILNKEIKNTPVCSRSVEISNHNQYYHAT